VEFGTRRAHTPQAGVLGARAAYIGGCIGTSNTLAASARHPVIGNLRAFLVIRTRVSRKPFAAAGPARVATIQLGRSYDPIEGTRRAAALGRPLWGIRLDSGDFLALSKQARAILDGAGLTDARIMPAAIWMSGESESWSQPAPRSRACSSGTELATSADAPSMGAIYKMVEVNGRPTRSERRQGSLPGAKQLFRFPGHDVLALAEEPCPDGAEALLRTVILKGQL